MKPTMPDWSFPLPTVIFWPTLQHSTSLSKSRQNPEMLSRMNLLLFVSSIWSISVVHVCDPENRQFVVRRQTFCLSIRFETSSQHGRIYLLMCKREDLFQETINFLDVSKGARTQPLLSWMQTSLISTWSSLCFWLDWRKSHELTFPIPSTIKWQMGQWQKMWTRNRLNFMILNLVGDSGAFLLWSWVCDVG